jgi:hypothetical protein
MIPMATELDDPATREALDLIVEKLGHLILETAGFSREEKTKWLSSRIAARQFDRQGSPPIDTVESVTLATAESILALSLAL